MRLKQIKNKKGKLLILNLINEVKKMKIDIKDEDCTCEKPDIKEKHPNGCSLNQILKCHGDQPIGELLKHVKIEKEEE